MTQRALPLAQLCEVAIKAARQAGEYIQSTDRKTLQRQFKQAGSSAASQIVTEVDVRSEAIIRQCLQLTCEEWDIAFLGEESSQGSADTVPGRLSKPYHWCVDPLDGTLPFMQGRPGYAVSIALVDRSGVALIGVVYDPVNATLIHAIKGQGAWRDLAPLSRPTTGPTTGPAADSNSLMVFADTSFSTQAQYADVLDTVNRCAQDSGLDGIELVYGNAAVKNACYVLEYPAACYVKLPKSEDGGGSTWDFAATACIVSEAGAWVSNIHGQALDLNRQDSTFMNHQGVIYASNEQLARRLVGGLKKVMESH